MDVLITDPGILLMILSKLTYIDKNFQLFLTPSDLCKESTANVL